MADLKDRSKTLADAYRRELVAGWPALTLEQRRALSVLLAPSTVDEEADAK